MGVVSVVVPKIQELTVYGTVLGSSICGRWKKETSFSVSEHSITFPDSHREAKVAPRHLPRSESDWQMIFYLAFIGRRSNGV